VEKYLQSLGRADVQLVGHHYAPLDQKDFRPAVAQIQEAQPDVIVSTINGASNVAFFSQLTSAGVTAQQIPVLSTSVGEDELRSMSPEAIRGHLSAWSYFQTIDTPRNRRFLRRFRGKHGDDRVVSDPMESAYAAVYLWKTAVERAQSIEVDAVREALSGNIEYSAPGGRVRLDPRNYHAYKRFRIGRAREDLQFEIVHESPDWIEPEPYPEMAFPGWHVDWTQQGLHRGPRVTIAPPA